MTPLPCTPSFVFGIVNIRGQILTVIDVKKFFELPDKGLTELNKVIVVRTPRLELGILADEIIGVRLIAPDELQSSLPTLTGVRAQYLRGVTSDRTVVLDVVRLLADEKLIVREEVE
jgi:purine-binding chemotaxis protein CheW